MLKPAILQFGTGRFLLAHVDLFVSEALDAGQALGGILVVQSTHSPASTARTAALADDPAYPVRIRGIEAGRRVDREVRSRSIVGAVHADADWLRVRTAVSSGIRVIVSNTADSGYQLDPLDNASALPPPEQVPRSFPAKLLSLLHLRWQSLPQAPLTILPCELVERNADTLRELVDALARERRTPDAFLQWMHGHCVWANTLVDRIVAEPIAPVGAVAEPYALWAIQRQPGLVLPCAHPAIVLTDDLQRYERLKLFLLNAGHTLLAEQWLRRSLADDCTVAQAMGDPALRDDLEAAWSDEILPVFDALGQGDEARRYIVTLRDRLQNPFLAHRLADIARHHAHKKQRRLAPVVALAGQLGLQIDQPRLRGALAEACA